MIISRGHWTGSQVVHGKGWTHVRGVHGPGAHVGEGGQVIHGL